MKKILLVIVALSCILWSYGCTDAQIASSNLSEAAENFEITRRIVFFNGITDKYLLSITGRCSIEMQAREQQLEVTCKIKPNQYKKHHLGLSDNVSYFSEQIETANVDVYHYRVTFKPSVIIPDIRKR